MCTHTVYGLVEGVFRWAGAVQGGKGSPQKWTAMEDVANTLWERKKDGGAQVPASEGRSASVVGAGFADDKRFIQDTLDAHNSLTRQDGDFLFFLGFETNVETSTAQVAAWHGEMGLLRLGVLAWRVRYNSQFDKKG